MKKLLYLSVVLLTTLACSESKSDEKRAKFEPEDGQCLIFAGQSIHSVGGLDDYNNGYCDYFETPAGVTVYMGLGAKGGSMEGLKVYSNWKSGESEVNRYIVDDTFDNCMIAIGLSLVGGEQLILSGKKDNDITILGNWLNSLNDRPIFLRVGYEFDGFDWNHYEVESYKAAYRYIKDHLDAMSVDNVAYIWQSKGWGIPLEEYEKWYPGDQYVDWCAYSYFDSPDELMIDFARSKGKPVMIAEATPCFKNSENYTDTDIKKPKIANRIWNEWFAGLFATIERNSDVVKALAYINTDWYAQKMWINSPAFQQIDSRIEVSPYVSEEWAKKIAEPNYLNAKDIKK